MKLGDFERIIKDAINEGLKEEMEKTLPVKKNQTDFNV